MASIRDTVARIINALARIEDDLEQLRSEVRATRITDEERPDRSLRLSEAAELLSCDESSIRKLAHRGELQAHRVGRSVRILLSSIDEYRQRQEIAPRAVAPPKPERSDSSAPARAI